MVLEQVELSNLLRRIIDTNRSVITASRVQVSLTPLPRIASDLTSLEQIFGNLVSNALKFIRSDAIRRIDIGVATETADKPGVVLFVRDNGMGIPESSQSRVFTAFTRLHPTVTVGDGLGLVVVKNAVERLGGKIWFESVENVGTTFFVYLPRIILPSGAAQRHLHYRQAAYG